MKFGVLLIAIAIALAGGNWMLRRWRTSFFLLLLFLPFAGGLALVLDRSSLKLAKDVLFVIPGYMAFLMAYRENINEVQVPPIVTCAIWFLAMAICLQSFNPSLSNLAIAVVGAKVWLLYIPLIYVGSCMIRSKRDLVIVFRLLAILAWIPCVFGLYQWWACNQYGYQTFMYSIYGFRAKEATHGFEYFTFGTIFYRIPSTFAYVTHYFGFILAMMIPTYSLMKMENKFTWKMFGAISFSLVLVAGIFCGARIFYLFGPLLIISILFFDGKLQNLAKMAVAVPIVSLVAIQIAGLDLGAIFSEVFLLAGHYFNDIVIKHIAIGLESAPWGRGTGSCTMATRYVGNTDISWLESYYAKAAYELGAPGLVMVIFFFVAILAVGYREFKRIHDEKLRSVGAAILAFSCCLALNNFKGFGLDWDPLNIYYWLFLGFLFKLRHLEGSPEVELSSQELQAPPQLKPAFST